MNTSYMRAPHQGGAAISGASSPHAALLIDFDNVTMGMRSDLSKELKTLLDSDVIKGKVSVQRAYADWRRYPQYIVPLSEASVDLIFAPAYGSNKKNATDIRMAIDALELVFIRPEIGTYILLTGDSDFSSLVLKLKEYGKYVIGVGIQESSSDILVQNCDEYYSYTSLTGLTKTTDLTSGSSDPWVLVKDALAKMVQRDDVMRSDRLKQVMQEIDPNFDEGGLGFSKFSKFLTEASSRGLVKLKKLENGQYEIEPPKGRSGRNGGSDSDGGRGRRDRKPRGGRRERRDRDDEAQDKTPAPEAPSAGAEGSPGSEDGVKDAIAILTGTLERLNQDGRESVRDSDVKRKILETHPDFDEGELGFSKFSKFLSEAVDRGAVVITKTENGASEVALPDAESSSRDAGAEQPVATRQREPKRRDDTPHESGPPPSSEQAPTGTHAPDSDGPTVIEVKATKDGKGLKLGPRRGSTRRRSSSEDTVPLFEGQTVAAPSSKERGSSTKDAPRQERSTTTVTQEKSAASEASPSGSAPAAETAAPSATGGGIDLKALGLPTDPDAIVRYMTHRYKGVGQKTAETLVDQFGADVFTVLRDDPERIKNAVPARRGEQVLEAWELDYDRRTEATASRGAS
ncbi:MAG: NYN domain-containing protein [Gemmatimonadota bacterium]